MNSGSVSNKQDNELAALLRQGNRLAFNEIYNRYWKRLYNYIYNILHDADLVEDTLQDVFTKVWILREETDIQNLKAYLFNAVRNNAISKLREAKLTRIQEEVIQGLSLSPDVEHTLNLEGLKHIIDKATQELPERCREIFYMSRFEHLSIQEIAGKLNISHRTVENQLSIALKHLRLTLSDLQIVAILLHAGVVMSA